MDSHEGDNLDYTVGLIFLFCFIIVCYITRLPNRFPVAIVDTYQNLQKWTTEPIHVNRCVNPFSISILNQDIASVENGIQLQVKSNTAALLNSFWGVKVDDLHKIIKSVQERISESGWRNQLLSQALVDSATINNYCVRLDKCKSSTINCKLLQGQQLCLGPLPRTSYPLVIVIEEESVNFSHDQRVVALIIIIHLPDEHYKRSCEILQQSVFTITGHLYQLQKIFTAAHQSEASHTQSDISDISLNDNPIANENADNICVVCHTQKIANVILPCRHSCLCQECLKNIQTCPLCRSVIVSYFPL